MHLMNKDFQKLETIYAAADKLTQAGIRPSFNMIFGFPGEGARSAANPFALVMDICRKYPGAEFWTNIFTPYPGAPIMQRAFELGIDVPQDARRLGRFFPALHRAAVAQGREASAKCRPCASTCAWLSIASPSASSARAGESAGASA